MRQELKRIEATLHQLAQSRHQLPNTDSKLSDPALDLPEAIDSTDLPRVSQQDPSPLLTVPTSVAIQSEFVQAESVQAESVQLKSPVTPAKLPIDQLKSAEAGLLDLTDIKTPALPRLKSPTFTTHRNAANPALAVNLLKEIGATVAGWQNELQQLLRQVQDLYLEGPIVDGWLESYAHEEGEASDLRHADVDCLLNYVDKLQNPAPASQINQRLTQQEPTEIATGYRLCGLNEDGQLWFRHCPPHQVPAVGMAISRYQRLRQLLTRKQYLEARLSQLAETLVAVHGQLTA